MLTQPQPYISPEEYLRREREASYKSEYFQGVIYPMGDREGDTPTAMAGATTEHNRLKSNVEFILRAHLRKRGGCETFSSDQRLHIPENGLFTYPDVVVLCGKIGASADDEDSLVNPTVIVEVLSKRTASYDRGEKFQLYRHIPTLREYLLVDSRKVAVTLHRKTEAGPWMLVSEVNRFDDSIFLESLACSLPLREIYLNSNLTDSLYILREP